MELLIALPSIFLFFLAELDLCDAEDELERLQIGQAAIQSLRGFAQCAQDAVQEIASDDGRQSKRLF